MRQRPSSANNYAAPGPSGASRRGVNYLFRPPLTPSTEEDAAQMESTRTTPIAARLENDIVATIKAYAAANNQTVSSTVATLIRRGVPALTGGSTRGVSMDA
jgi:hypothetical protein